MSIQNLKCKSQKLVTVQKANFSTKIESYKQSVYAKGNAVKAAAIVAVDQAQAQIVNAAQAIATAALQPIIDSLKNINDSLATAKKLRAQQRALLEKAPEVCTVLPADYDPQKPINVVDTTASLPTTNDKPVGDIAIDLKNVKDSQSLSSDKRIEAAMLLHKKMPTLSITEIQTLIRTLYGRDPETDDVLDMLPYFQKMSEYTGENLLTFTLDKPSIQLEDWKTPSVQCLRPQLVKKLPTDMQTQIQNEYTKLNTLFLKNISNEFFQERRILSNGSAGYHLQTDALYPTHFATTTPLPAFLISQLSIYPLPLLVQVDDYQKIPDDKYEIPIEGKYVTIDLKGNPIADYSPSTPPSTNPKSLTPIIPT